MPKREDENSASWKQSDLRYCPGCKKFASASDFYKYHYGQCFFVPEWERGQRKPKDEFAEHRERMQRTKVSRTTPPPFGTYRGTLAAGDYKKRRRFPLGKVVALLVIFSLVGAVVCAFAGLAPFSTAMDGIVDFFSSSEQGSTGEGGAPVPTLSATSTPTPTLPPVWIGPDGEREHEYVMYLGGYLIGGDGHRIELFNNPEAKNPTWSELVAFLRQDTTDEHYYEPLSFVCADFAEMLHNNAEVVGVRAAYVHVGLGTARHACNAFDTVDRGLLYIDCTGLPSWESYPCSSDKIVTIIAWGGDYRPKSIFPCHGWKSTWESIGTVTYVSTQW